LICRLNFIKPAILVRLYGGLGNQLFTYAAAFRLARYNNCELFIDTKSGFIRDYKYQRKFSLNSFSISARAIKIPYFFYYILSFFIPFFNKINRKLPFQKRVFIVQDRISFNESLLHLNINSPKLFEGYWQSEKYFKDVEAEIRTELTILKPIIKCFDDFKGRLDYKNSVAIHVRHFRDTQQPSQGNISNDYYYKAIDFFCSRFHDVQFWLFSDNPSLAKSLIFSNSKNCHLVSDNFGNLSDVQELYFMSQFSYFIISNSTFSWWGAWLSESVDKIVIAPSDIIEKGEGLWGFDGLLPDEWIKF